MSEPILSQHVGWTLCSHLYDGELARGPLVRQRHVHPHGGTRRAHGSHHGAILRSSSGVLQLLYIEAYAAASRETRTLCPSSKGT